MCKKILFLFLLFPFAKLTAQDSLSMVFVGDAMAHLTQTNNAWTGKEYDFSQYYVYIKDEISKADFGVVNFEVPLAGPPFSGYPCFSAPDVFAHTLKDAGFNVFLHANNHCLDKGVKGMGRTLSILDTLGIKYMGAYADQASRNRLYPCLLVKNGFRIAMLNYTYGTNGFSVKPPFVVNYIDKEVMAADIEEAKRMKPDIIIANMHWGNEYQLLPSAEQKELTQWLFQHGVRIVMGSHPHVVQPMVMRKDAEGKNANLVVYSLGNFVSNMPFPNTTGGGLVKIVLTKEDGKTDIASAQYSLLFTHRSKFPDGRTSYQVVPGSAWCDSPEKDSVVNINKLREYIKGVRTLLDKHNINVEEYKFE